VHESGVSAVKTMTRQDIVKWLESKGYRFTELTLISEGDYAVEDADWNYKDVPHIHFVHPLAEQSNFVLAEPVKCAVQLQGFLKIWLPLLNVAYETDRFRYVYVSTLFFFVIAVETHSEALAPLRTRVVTHYSIGTPRLLFFLAPFMKWAVRRNYRILMADDIPMRERRGALRKLGYSFAKRGQSYGFMETTKIAESHLRPPPGGQHRLTCNYQAELADGREALIGDIGLLGFRLVRDGTDVLVFPRACPHEGASLDDRPCESGVITCRWHGRRLPPIVKFAWAQPADFSNPPYRGSVAGNRLTIEYDDGMAASGRTR